MSKKYFPILHKRNGKFYFKDLHSIILDKHLYIIDLDYDNFCNEKIIKLGGNFDINTCWKNEGTQFNDKTVNGRYKSFKDKYDEIFSIIMIDETIGFIINVYNDKEKIAFFRFKYDDNKNLRNKMSNSVREMYRYRGIERAVNDYVSSKGYTIKPKYNEMNEEEIDTWNSNNAN